MSALRNLMRTIYDYSIFNPLNKNTRASNAIGISRLPRVNNQFFSTTVNTLFKAIKYFFPRFRRKPSMNGLEKKKVTFLTDPSLNGVRRSLEHCQLSNSFINKVLNPHNNWYNRCFGLPEENILSIEDSLKIENII